MIEADFERMGQNMKKLEEYVRSIPDFPEPGIIFRDVTSILQDADGLHLAIDQLIDMVKDLEEAIYYCTITKAMEEKEKSGNGGEKEYHYYTEYRYPERDMDRENGKMYYNMMPMTYTDQGRMYYNGGGSSGGSGSSGSGGSSGGNSGGGGSSSGGSRNYSEYEYPMMRDSREGRSPMSRKTYMESKEMH